MKRCDETQAWGALQGHFEAHGRDLDLRVAFARDPGRFDSFSLQAPEVFADLSKNLIDIATRRFLLDLARECGLEAQRDALLRGDVANTTEGRAVLHTALRAPRGQGPFSDEVHAVLDAMLTYADRVRGDNAITDIVNIGIGGSDLGPAMVVPALDACSNPAQRLHFVSNVDGHDIAPLLQRLDAKRTLFIVASKTFTTQETMANANAARGWFVANSGKDGGADGGAQRRAAGRHRRPGAGALWARDPEGGAGPRQHGSGRAAVLRQRRVAGAGAPHHRSV